MAYFPPTGSVISYQGIPSSLVSGSSIFGQLPGGTAILGSIVTLQGTNPWVTNVGASVATVIIGGSVATATTNSSVMALNSSAVIGSVVTLQGTNPWIITGSVQTTVQTGNSSVQVLNFPATQNVSGSVASFPQGTIISSLVNIIPSSVQVGVSVMGHAPVVIVGGSVATATTNSSVMFLSGTNVIGSVTVLQGTNPFIITGSIQGGGAGTEYAEDAVVPSVTGTAFMFRANQSSSIMDVVSPGAPLPVSVQGTVNISGTPNVNTAGSVIAFQGGTWTPSISGTVGASLIGLGPVRLSDGSETLDFYEENQVDASVVGTALMFKSNVSTSILSVVSPTNPLPVSVQGTVNIGTQSGSVIAFQGTTPWTISSVYGNISGSVAAYQAGTQITSLVSTIPSSVIVGASIFGLPPVNVTNTNLNIGGSVVAFQGPGWSGSVAAFGAGTWVTSLVSTIPSSVIVGASIFGLPPVNVTNTNLNVGGSVIAFQGTNPWVTGSIIGTYAEDAAHTSADRGLFTLGVRNDAVASFVSANLDYSPIGLDSAGRTLIKPFAAEESRIEGVASVVHTSVTTLVAAAGAGLRNYITDIALSNGGSVATTVTFRSNGGTSILGNFIVPSGGGNNVISLAVPIRTLANETFDFQASTAVSVLYANVFGFKAP